MGIPVRWICTKCGKKVASAKKPGENNTSYPKCPNSPSGVHNWVRY